LKLNTVVKIEFNLSLVFGPYYPICPVGVCWSHRQQPQTRVSPKYL